LITRANITKPSKQLTFVFLLNNYKLTSFSWNSTSLIMVKSSLLWLFSKKCAIYVWKDGAIIVLGLGVTPPVCRQAGNKLWGIIMKTKIIPTF
jgi:hypothetical protein